MKTPTAIAVKAVRPYRIWIRYSDGAEGEVDLAHLAGKGVFRWWDEAQNFQRVYISPAGAIAWSEQIELCPDSVYLKLTGKSVGDLFPSLQSVSSHA